MKKAIEPPKKKPPPKQHQDFDNVAKKTFSRVYASIIHKLLGLDKMPIIYDLTKDIRFKEGKEIGEEKGIEKGILKQARSSTIRLLKRGILSPVEIAEIQDVPLAFVLKIQKGLDKNPNLK